MTTPLTDVQLKQYDEQGYIILENFFTKEEMDRLTARIDVFNARSEELSRRFKHSEVNFLTANTINVPDQITFTARLIDGDPLIKQFVCQEKLALLCGQLLSSDVKLYWEQSVYKNPEATRDFPWHQDNSYGEIEPEHYVTCWLALEDTTVENGCIWIVPGTHKLGMVPHQDTDIGKQCYFEDDPGMPVPLKKGSMVVFHSLLFHRSTPNRSNSVRKGYVMQYSVDGAFNPETGEVYDYGPVILRGGKPVSSSRQDSGSEQ